MAITRQELEFAASSAYTTMITMLAPMSIVPTVQWDGNASTIMNCIDVACQFSWDTFKGDPGWLVLSDTSKKVLDIATGGTTSGTLNKITGTMMKVVAAPGCPTNTILLLVERLPTWYPGPGPDGISYDAQARVFTFAPGYGHAVVEASMAPRTFKYPISSINAIQGPLSPMPTPRVPFDVQVQVPDNMMYENLVCACGTPLNEHREGGLTRTIERGCWLYRGSRCP